MQHVDSQSIETLKKNKFLPQDLPQDIKDRINLTGEALYSFTEWDIAEEITELIITYLYDLNPKYKDWNWGNIFPERIIDGTAGGGGNVISFARHFEEVIAVEKSQERADELKNTLDLVGLDKYVEVYCDDICDLGFLMRRDDVLFLDPPWGGPDYKYSKNMTLNLCDRSLGKLCYKLGNKVQLIVLKVPFNFNLTRFKKDVKTAFYVQNFYRGRKLVMKLILLSYVNNDTTSA